MQKMAEKYFRRLNQKLQEEGITLTVICVGGYALSCHNIRETMDIDAFYKQNKRIEEIIKEVGEEFGINRKEETWLNNSVENLNLPPDDKICDMIYDFSNLKILMPPLIYIAGMKLASMREQDIEDVSLIIKKLKITDIEDFRAKLKEYHFENPDESLILTAFSYAYGMDWLEKYYISHEATILENLKNSSGFYDRV